MKRQRWGCYLVAGAATLAGGLLAAPQCTLADTFQLNPIIVSGVSGNDPRGPGFGDDTRFGFTQGLFSLNDAGQAAFYALLQGSSIDGSNAGSVWHCDGNALELIARDGSELPGQPGVTIGSIFRDTFLSDTGDVNFRAFSLSGSGVNSTNNAAQVIVSPDGVQVLRKGAAVPGVPAATFDHIDFGKMGGNGQFIVKSNNIIGPGVDDSNNEGIWAGDLTSLQPLARESGPASVIPGATYTSVGSGASAKMGSGGHYVMQVRLTGGGVTAVDDDMLLTGTVGGATSIAVRQGDAAPGTAGTFGAFGGNDLSINDSGELAFDSIVDVSGTFLRAIYTGTPGSLSLAALEGQTAPGTTAQFSNFSNSFGFPDAGPLLTDSGYTAFYGYLSGADVTEADDSGIWVHHNGTTNLALREGMAVLGETGVTIGDILQWTVNDNGFVAAVTGLLGSDPDEIALWMIDPAGNAEILLRSGDQIDVDPGAGVDLRTVTQGPAEGIAFSGNAVGVEKGVGGVFNNRNTLLFQVSFTDSANAIFTVTVPEPASITLVAISAMALLSWRRCL